MKKSSFCLAKFISNHVLILFLYKEIRLSPKSHFIFLIYLHNIKIEEHVELPILWMFLVQQNRYYLPDIYKVFSTSLRCFNKQSKYINIFLYNFVWDWICIFYFLHWQNVVYIMLNFLECLTRDAIIWYLFRYFNG